jgi:hypothetical protein
MLLMAAIELFGRRAVTLPRASLAEIRGAVEVRGVVGVRLVWDRWAPGYWST